MNIASCQNPLSSGRVGKKVVSNRNGGEIAVTTRFLTEIDVSERTRVSVATLRRWRLENKGPRFHKFGSLVRYAEEDLTSWQDAQPTGGENPDRIKSVLAKRHPQASRPG